MSDVAYKLTRTKGEAVTAVRTLGTEANPETGARDITTEVHNVRLVVREHTSYSRIIKAKMAQLDVGQTTFIFWTRDIPFNHLNVEDYIISEDQKFQVVTSTREGTALVVTAKEVAGTVGKQEIELDSSQSMGLDQTVVEP